MSYRQRGNKKFPVYIAISGLAGTGKSTSTHLVAKELGIEPLVEDLSEIPAYTAWLNSGEGLYQVQLDFLYRAFKLQRQARSRGGVQERTIYENYEVSVRFYYERGMLSQQEFDLITSTYKDMCQQVHKPDLLFHLTASVETLLERTASRGRLDDLRVRVSEMRELKQYYEMMLAAWRWCPVVSIDTSSLSANNVASLVVEKTRHALHL